MVMGLWDFSVAHYARPGVAQACIQVQDSWGGNTTLLLFACWLEMQQIELRTERLDTALGVVQEWDIRYVQPLRELRRQMKTEFTDRLEEVEQVRHHIKKAELYAERKELEWLEALSANWIADDNLELGENIARYLKFLRVPDELTTELISLLANYQSV